MDIIEGFLEKHGQLRQELAALEAPFQRPHGVGWDDCVSLDRPSLLRGVESFLAGFKDHEADEDEFFARVAGELTLDAKMSAAFAEGRRAVYDIMKVFGAVAFTCDGEHVHRVRESLSRLREELEAHLAYEEKVLFPLLRERLPASRLRELGEKAHSLPR